MPQARGPLTVDHFCTWAVTLPQRVRVRKASIGYQSVRGDCRHNSIRTITPCSLGGHESLESSTLRLLSLYSEYRTRTTYPAYLMLGPRRGKSLRISQFVCVDPLPTSQGSNNRYCWRSCTPMRGRKRRQARQIGALLKVVYNTISVFLRPF